LETFALADVLGLLATTAKTGELRVAGRRREGRLWFDQGEVVGGRIGAVADPVDVLVELLRLEGGEFTFDMTARPQGDGPTRRVGEVLADAQARAIEWTEIERVVPSVDVAVNLVADVAGDEITLTADEWRVVVAVARRGSVRKVMFDLALSEIEVCRRIKTAVEAGLVAVGASVPVLAEGADDREAAMLRRQLAEIGDPEPAPVPDAESVAEVDPEVAGEGSEGPGPAPVAVPVGVPAEDDAVNRGALLKFLSSVRS
jgi:hypothetical protein